MSDQEENTASSTNGAPEERRGNAAADGAGTASSPSPSPASSDAAAATATKRRREIQSIMRDATLTDLERRLRIQQLMDGSSAAASAAAAVTNDVVHRNNSDGGIGSIVSSLSIHGNNNISSNTNDMNNITQHNHSTRNDENNSNNDIGDAPASTTSNNNQNIHNHNIIPPTTSNTPSAPVVGDAESTQEAAVSCIHYERKCNIVAPCCQRAFGCRLCHDDIMSHPSTMSNSSTNATKHNNTHSSSNTKCKIPMDRYAISQIICKACHTLQSSKTNVCLHCQIPFAEYHCAICNIWMSNTQSPFHCSKCGMCRVGGSTNYKHCDLCGMCLSIAVYESHHCKFVTIGVGCVDDVACNSPLPCPLFGFDFLTYPCHLFTIDRGTQHRT